MQTSIFIAKLIGPLLAVMGIGMLIDTRGYRAMAREFLASRALIYVAGLAAFVPGLAIVILHNVWTADWRVTITLFGWLALIGGAFRLLAPRMVTQVGTAVLDKPSFLTGAAVAVIALGTILSFFGYLR